MSQSRLEASMAMIDDLIRQRESLTDTRMSKMLAILKERGREDVELLKPMSEQMQRQDSDGNNLMVELMTTMKDLFLVVRTVVTQTAAPLNRPPLMPMASNYAIVLSTSAFLPRKQTTYRKVAQTSAGTRPSNRN